MLSVPFTDPITDTARFHAHPWASRKCESSTVVALEACYSLLAIERAYLLTIYHSALFGLLLHRDARGLRTGISRPQRPQFKWIYGSYYDSRCLSWAYDSPAHNDVWLVSFIRCRCKFAPSSCFTLSSRNTIIPAAKHTIGLADIVLPLLQGNRWIRLCKPRNRDRRRRNGVQRRRLSRCRGSCCRRGRQEPHTLSIR